jgi:hypothetical protein
MPGSQQRPPFLQSALNASQNLTLHQIKRMILHCTLKYTPKLSKQFDLLLEKDFLPVEFFMISEEGEKLFTSCVFTPVPL